MLRVLITMTLCCGALVLLLKPQQAISSDEISLLTLEYTETLHRVHAQIKVRFDNSSQKYRLELYGANQAQGKELRSIVVSPRVFAKLMAVLMSDRQGSIKNFERWHSDSYCIDGGTWTLSYKGIERKICDDAKRTRLIYQFYHTVLGLIRISF